jgi:hypothetical protein
MGKAYSNYSIVIEHPYMDPELVLSLFQLIHLLSYLRNKEGIRDCPIHTLD